MSTVKNQTAYFDSIGERRYRYALQSVFISREVVGLTTRWQRMKGGTYPYLLGGLDSLSGSHPATPCTVRSFMGFGTAWWWICFARGAKLSPIRLTGQGEQALNKCSLRRLDQPPVVKCVANHGDLRQVEAIKRKGEIYGYWLFLLLH